MKYTKTLLILLISLLFAFGCSEIKNDITPPVDLTHHPEGFGDASSPNFHKNVFVKNNWSFNLTKCQSCHTADYSGGTTGSSCLGCHTHPKGPESCNTCHGSFADPNFIAPPNDLEGNSDNGSVGVGAHFTHVYNNSKSTNVGCFECHQQTTGTKAYVHAHISAPAASDLHFGSFSHPDSLNVTPSYNSMDNTCSNTYCHGGFKFGDIVGNNKTVTWNSTTNKEAECGTCHGKVDANGDLVTPLPTGHFGNYGISACANCHSSVVNSEGVIIDKIKHINKQKDF